jgi:hypothetical protein
MHTTPIGPTGAAIEKPMASPLSRKVLSFYSPVTSATMGERGNDDFFPRATAGTLQLLLHFLRGKKR